MRTILMLALALALIGCAHGKKAAAQYPPLEPFSAPSWSSGQGSASITGQAFLRTNGGEVRTCAGSRVLLVPVTPYTESVLNLRRARGATDLNPELLPFIRTTTCDAQANFQFENLPDGAWFLETSVEWLVRIDELPQGGALLTRIETHGDKARLILAQEQLLPRGCLPPKKHRCTVAKSRRGLFDVPVASGAQGQ